MPLSGPVSLYEVLCFQILQSQVDQYKPSLTQSYRHTPSSGHTPSLGHHGKTHSVDDVLTTPSSSSSSSVGSSSSAHSSGQGSRGRMRALPDPHLLPHHRYWEISLGLSLCSVWGGEGKGHRT